MHLPGEATDISIWYVADRLQRPDTSVSRSLFRSKPRRCSVATCQLEAGPDWPRRKDGMHSSEPATLT